MLVAGCSQCGQCSRATYHLQNEPERLLDSYSVTTRPPTISLTQSNQDQSISDIRSCCRLHVHHLPHFKYRPLTVSHSTNMDLNFALLFGKMHFEWALRVFFPTALAISSITTDLTPTLQFYSECLLIMLLISIFTPDWITTLYATLTHPEACELALFYALTALIFIHFLKLYFHISVIRGTARIRFAVELLVFALLISSFVGLWSTWFVVCFQIVAYDAQSAANGGL